MNKQEQALIQGVRFAGKLARASNPKNYHYYGTIRLGNKDFPLEIIRETLPKKTPLTIRFQNSTQTLAKVASYLIASSSLYSLMR